MKKRPDGSIDFECKRIQTDRGSHIEPPLDEKWAPLHQLQWQASVLEADTGVAVRVTEAKYWRDGVRQRGYFDVESCGPMGFNDAWSFLNGIETGIRIERSARRKR